MPPFDAWTPTLWDHLISVALVIGMPVHSTVEFRKFRRAVRAGIPEARVRQYRQTFLLEWGLALAVVALWAFLGRPLTDLGLSLPPGPRAWVGLVLTTLGVVFLVFQWAVVRSLTADGVAVLRAQMAQFEELFPSSRLEYRWFQVLSVTAGICEELLYRGYLLPYLVSTARLDPWLAVLAGGVIFGIAHAYQGRAGILKTGIIGILAGFLYVGTGSLLWPMILHAAIDLQGGAIGRWVLGARE